MAVIGEFLPTFMSKSAGLLVREETDRRGTEEEDAVRLGSDRRAIMDASELANTTTSVVARVIATLSLRSPPCRLSGLKFIDMVFLPGSVGR